MQAIYFEQSSQITKPVFSAVSNEAFGGNVRRLASVLDSRAPSVTHDQGSCAVHQSQPSEQSRPRAFITLVIPGADKKDCILWGRLVVWYVVPMGSAYHEVGTAARPCNKSLNQVSNSSLITYHTLKSDNETSA